MKRDDPRFPCINEPFGTGRDSFRLAFDFGAMLSCFSPRTCNQRVLDFCAGSGWISEWLNRLGLDVYSIDLNDDVGNVLKLRMENDSRLDPERMHFQVADGHQLPFECGFFGHLCSFDSLHHMRDYPKVLSELFRVLELGGRVIFVEPGAKHSSSQETVEFIQKYKKDDPTWIERDVVLDEIYQIAMASGFSSLVIRPILMPNLVEYHFHTWQAFRKGDRLLEASYLDLLREFNYSSRLVFYLEKE